MNLRKTTGSYTTPSGLADFLTKETIEKPGVTVFDPCFGSGSILSASFERLAELGSASPEHQVYGYDISPKEREKCLTNHSDKLMVGNLYVRDFLRVPKKEHQGKWDILLMNPPFVRHHLLPASKVSEYQRLVEEEIRLPRTSDLWAYFLIHSPKFVRKGGTVGAILPWSFLSADFSSSVRQFLSECFGRIRVIAIGDRLFKSAQERIVVVIAEAFGKRAKRIGMSYSNVVPDLPTHYHSIGKELWRKSAWAAISDEYSDELMSDARKRWDMLPLGAFSKVKIGIVTGANGFFVFPKEAAEKMDLPKDFLRPVLATSKELRSLTVNNSTRIDNVLLTIPPNQHLPKAIKDYIQDGKEMSLDKRYHTKKRKEWYLIEDLEVPDAFFPYMTKEIPFLVINKSHVLCTNSIHRLAFDSDVDEIQRRWIQLSMFTTISQLSAEVTGRTYGGGVLKIEPSGLRRILVWPGNGEKLSSRTVHEFEALLHEGNRRRIVELADDILQEALGISSDGIGRFSRCYRSLRNKRLGL